MPTVLLLCVWTLWLVIAFPLLRPSAGAVAGVLFVVSAMGFWAWTDVTWRSYLMSWLVIHLAAAVVAARYGEITRPLVAGLVSVIGFGWLWIEGGAAHWRWALTTAVVVAVVTAASVALRAQFRRAAARPAPAAGLPPVRYADPDPPDVPVRPAPPPPATSGSTLRYSPRPPAARRPRTAGRTAFRSPSPLPDAKKIFDGERGATPPMTIPAPPPAVVAPPTVGCWTGPGRARARPATGPGLTFDVAVGGARRTPRPIPAFALSVGAPDESLPVLGLARFFPGGTLHGAFAAAPPGGPPCPLSGTGHHHVRRVEASLEAFIEQPAATLQALTTLVLPPGPPAVKAFQQSLLRSGAVGSGPVAAHTVTMTTVDGGEGDHVVELTVLSVVDLLARDEAAVGAYAGALGATPALSSVARFLRSLLAAAHLDIDLALAGAHDDAVLCLFGSASARRGCAIPVPVAEETDDWWESLRHTGSG